MIFFKQCNTLTILKTEVAEVFSYKMGLVSSRNKFSYKSGVKNMKGL